MTNNNDGTIDKDAKKGDSTSFVITGFGPFGGVDENPTTCIVRQLDSHLRSSNPDCPSSASNNTNGCNVALADCVKEYIVLETSAEDVNKTMDRVKREYIEAPKAKEQERPQKIVLLHLGVARSSCFRLEACAYNEATFRIPDQKGYQPMATPIVPSHELGKCYETTLDLEGLKQTLEKEFPAISTSLSTDPGRYVCNYVYCKSLEISLPYSMDNSAATEAAQTTTATTNPTIENDGGEDYENNTICCSSLFLHVPHFSVVSKEDQLAYVSGVLRALAK